MASDHGGDGVPGNFACSANPRSGHATVKGIEIGGQHETDCIMKPVRPRPTPRTIASIERAERCKRSLSNLKSGQQKRSGDHSIQTFPLLLMRMIDDSRSRGIVGWSADGDSFAILRKDDFCKKVLPPYFGNIKYESFMRRLNRHGFETTRIITLGRKDTAIWHPHFRRDYPELCELVVQTDSPIPQKKRRVGFTSHANASNDKDENALSCRGSCGLVPKENCPHEGNPPAAATEKHHHLLNLNSSDCADLVGLESHPTANLAQDCNQRAIQCQQLGEVTANQRRREQCPGIVNGAVAAADRASHAQSRENSLLSHSEKRKGNHDHSTGGRVPIGIFPSAENSGSYYERLVSLLLLRQSVCDRLQQALQKTAPFHHAGAGSHFASLSR